MTSDTSDVDGDPEGSKEAAPGWPIKGPATPRQAILAIALVFFLGVAIGLALGLAF